MKIVFFGTPRFAAVVLRYLLDNQVEIAAVVTRPDKPKGRSDKLIPTPVKEVALEHHIPVYQPEKVSSPVFAEVLTPIEADLFVVVAYGEIVKQHILDMPKLGCINLHTSLLPKYRGAAPIQRAVMNGEMETGVSIMYMVKKMDAGDIIRTQKLAIGENETFGELEERLCRVGSEMMLSVISDFRQGPLDGRPQNDDDVTFAPKVELEDCEIDWTKPANEIHNLVRGSQPYPGAWCWVDVKGEKKRMKIKKTLIGHSAQAAPGSLIRVNQEGLELGCGEGSLIIKFLQLEGKKAMTPDELFRGTRVTF